MFKSFIFRSFVLIGVFFISLIVSCDRNRESSQNMLQITNKPVVEQIRQRGKLIAVTQYNSIDYFLHHGEPAGYQFEILKAFARYLHVELEIVVRNDLTEAIHLINRGQADLIAGDLFAGRVDTSTLDLSFPVGKTRLVVVQPVSKEQQKTVLRTSDLSGRSFTIADITGAQEQIEAVTGDLPVKPAILVARDVEPGELIKRVAGGEADFTVADEKTAMTFASLYPNLDISVPLSSYRTTHWGTRKGTKAWQIVVNNWLGQYMGSAAALNLYRKYFDKSILRRAAASNMVQSARLSDYDQLLRKLTQKLGWDWRLIAALIYQESKFSPEAISYKGASGIMQLMPATAAEYGIDSLSTPPEHIVAGVDLLIDIDRQFRSLIADSLERTRFVLASYNVGIGHVLDARRLALKHGKNPDHWDDVEAYLVMKSLPAYYSDKVVYYGYCRGDEPANFVKDVMKRYTHYCNLVKK